MGKKYGIVGLNGSGKTTFVSLLMGLYHTYTGEIRMNGVSIKDIPTQVVQAYFSPVMQNFGTYAYTIHENISLSEEIDVEKIERLLNQVGMLDKVRSLPKGLNTYITEEYNDEGTDLSGGEKQKIAIARAFYKKDPFNILDEPTSALDPLAERGIFDLFDKFVEDRVGIYISHRMPSIKMADEIFVLDKGKIVEHGTMEDLLRNKGLFFEFYTL